MGYTLGYDTVSFPPNATAEEIADDLVVRANEIVIEGTERLLLQFAVQALLPAPPAED